MTLDDTRLTKREEDELQSTNIKTKTMTRITRRKRRSKLALLSLLCQVQVSHAWSSTTITPTVPTTCTTTTCTTATTFTTFTFAPSMLLPLSTPTIGSSFPPSIRVTSSTPLDTYYSSSSSRGVLGFDVLSAARSSVNLETWKGQPQETQICEPTWLPWMPTRLQIESLKVNELRAACAQRGLVKSGTKQELRNRLSTWTVQQQQQHQEKITGDFLTRCFEQEAATTQFEHPAIDTKNHATTEPPNSLAEWARTVDLEPLLQRRKEIHRVKRQGKPSPKQKQPKDKQSRKEYLQSLTKALKAPTTSLYASNIQVKELYAASKQADQLGETKVAMDLLHTLLAVTPNDARTYRRLARMYAEQGKVEQARATLQKGLRVLPNNAWLWHGMGQLELKHGTVQSAQTYFQTAMEQDPTLAHSYHALGTLLHSQGHISKAMRTIQQGLEFCPQNHRLWHAYGDLYRSAHLLDDAQRAYKRALEHGPPVSHSFALSSLATVAYEQEDVDKARLWLSKSIQINQGRHAQGWVKWAQLEESEGNMDKAFSICAEAIRLYERGLVQARQRYLRQSQGSTNTRNNDNNDSLEFTQALLWDVPRYRSGDKFLSVYRNWARLAEQHKSFEVVDWIYERSSLAFPNDYKVMVAWADYHSRMLNMERARHLLQTACDKAGSRNAEPYRKLAELEMSVSNYQEARRILFRGASVVSETVNGGLGNSRGLSELYHSWAICEWHLGNLNRSQVLFDHALRLTPEGSQGGSARSIIFFSMAKLEDYRRMPRLAQHFIGLALKEDALPHGNAKLWFLWARIAKEMKNPQLQAQCLTQAKTCKAQARSSSSLALPSLQMRYQSKDLPGVSTIPQVMKQEPWQYKLFGSSQKVRDFSDGVRFPKRKPTASRIIQR